MKTFRNLLLSLIAFTVVAGAIIPANAATVRHHGNKHHRRHHHK